ncbi:MAG: phospholipase D family protein [Oscillospiraceae bacterium]|nr:phospholipase D family protein [Oscillospiraceae bacterium]
MAISRVTKEHNSLIRELFEKTTGSIKIVSPFITRAMGNILVNCKKQTPGLKAEIITRFYRENFIQGVSEIGALKKLNDCGVKIYALQDLHAKLYLFDDDSALIGSANFTSGGFKSNHELSLHITDEPDANGSLVDYFDELLKAILSQSTEYLLTSEKIADEQAEVERNIKKCRADKGNTNEKRFGAKLPTFGKLGEGDSGLSGSDSIQTILSTENERETIKTRNEQTQSGKNTPEIMTAASEVAKMVYDGTISGAEGKNMISEQTGMNINSAADSINTYRKMHEGERYTRCMNSWGTRIFFENIHKEYGDEALGNALKAARAHVDYYEDVNGYRQRKIVELINEFAMKI